MRIRIRFAVLSVILISACGQDPSELLTNTEISESALPNLIQPSPEGDEGNSLEDKRLTGCSLLTEAEVEAVLGPLIGSLQGGVNIGEGPSAGHRGGASYDCILPAEDQFIWFEISKRDSLSIARTYFERTLAWEKEGVEFLDTADMDTEQAYWIVDEEMIIGLRILADNITISFAMTAQDSPEARDNILSLANLVVGRLPESKGLMSTIGPEYDACILFDEAEIESVFGALISIPQPGSQIVKDVDSIRDIAYSCLFQPESGELVYYDLLQLESHSAVEDEFNLRYGESNLMAVEDQGMQGYWSITDSNLSNLHLIWGNLLIDFNFKLEDTPENRAAVKSLGDLLIIRLERGVIQ